MSGSVNKIKSIFLPIKFIIHLYGMTFDGDSTLLLKIHVIKHLGLHILSHHSIGSFKKTVG